MKSLLQNMALSRGYTLAGASSLKDVRDLIERLHPVAPSKPLIRLGPDGDGGYLVPDVMDEIGVCFSPGVNDQIDLELDLAERGIKSYLADFSVPGLPREHELLHFDPLFVDAYTDIEQGGHRICLDDWVNSKLGSDPRDDLLLQMDIENSEYASILAASSDTLKRFKVLVFEFHNIHKLFDPIGLMIYRSCFDKILQHFDVVHLHPNNFLDTQQMNDLVIPRCMEFTFERKATNAVHDKGYVSAFPHPLDRECVSDKPPLPLPRCWYR